jgi:DNA-binding transcriptional regulator YdaS (Cro superfamily)
MNPQRYSSVLHCAAAVLGGDERLAAFLAVPPDSLRDWLRGAAPPPPEVIVSALDVLVE